MAVFYKRTIAGKASPWGSIILGSFFVLLGALVLFFSVKYLNSYDENINYNKTSTENKDKYGFLFIGGIFIIVGACAVGVGIKGFKNGEKGEVLYDSKYDSISNDSSDNDTCLYESPELNNVMKNMQVKQTPPQNTTDNADSKTTVDHSFIDDSNNM